MVFINSKIYEDGINSTLINTNDMMSLVLLDNSNQVLATSAIIKGENEDGYLSISEKLEWDSEKKRVSIKNFDFEDTRSVIQDDGVATVSFALIKILDDQVHKGEDGNPIKEKAYEESTKELYWPEFDTYPLSEDNILISGNIINQFDVQKDSNFMFERTEIAFSEMQ